MLYRALKSFAGIAISMAAGAVGEIPDRALADDLINAGYIEPAEPMIEEPNIEEPIEKAPAKKTAKKGGKGK